MLTIWKSLVRSKLDYTSQIWSTSDQASISSLESVARHFTGQIHGMENLDYWERLQSLHLYSRERYCTVTGVPGSLQILPQEGQAHGGSPEQFKVQLDGWLSTVPDQPTIPGIAKTNSLLGQVSLVLN